MRISICGSMQFEKEMQAAASELQALGYDTEKPNSVEGHAYGVGQDLDEFADLKQGFINEHFEKIDRSDAILVVNLGKKGIEGYIGGNTLMEMTYAYAQGLDIFLLNTAPTEVSYVPEINAMMPVVLEGDVSGVDSYMQSLPTVHISSESAVKHLAVSRAFRRSGNPVQLRGAAVQSGVSEQPTSLDETYEGAINRHESLVKSVEAEKGDYLVTIESGIHEIRPEHNYFGCSTVVVESVGGTRHVGIDTDIEFPRHMTDRVPSEFKDLGALVKAEYGATESDPFPYFTNQKLTRAKILENAVFNVVVQMDSVHKK